MKNEAVRYAIQGTAALRIESEDQEILQTHIIDFLKARAASSNDGSHAAACAPLAKTASYAITSEDGNEQLLNDLSRAAAYVRSSAASSFRESRTLLSSGSSAGCEFGALKPWQTVLVLAFFSVGAFLIAFAL